MSQGVSPRDRMFAPDTDLTRAAAARRPSSPRRASPRSPRVRSRPSTGSWNAAVEAPAVVYSALPVHPVVLQLNEDGEQVMRLPPKLGTVFPDLVTCIPSTVREVKAAYNKMLAHGNGRVTAEAVKAFFEDELLKVGKPTSPRRISPAAVARSHRVILASPAAGRKAKATPIPTSAGEALSSVNADVEEDAEVGRIVSSLVPDALGNISCEEFRRAAYAFLAQQEERTRAGRPSGVGDAGCAGGGSISPRVFSPSTGSPRPIQSDPPDFAAVAMPAPVPCRHTYWHHFHARDTKHTVIPVENAPAHATDADRLAHKPFEDGEKRLSPRRIAVKAAILNAHNRRIAAAYATEDEFQAQRADLRVAAKVKGISLLGVSSPEKTKKPYRRPPPPAVLVQRRQHAAQLHQLLFPETQL